MTLPNGAAGVDTTNGIFLVSANGYGDMSAADLVGNDQPAVKAILANKYLLSGNSVLTDPTGPLAQVWEGLRQGISMPMAIIEQIAIRLLGLPPGTEFPTLDDIITELTQMVSVGDVLGGTDSGGAGFPWVFPVNFGAADSPIKRYFGNWGRIIGTDLSLPGLDINDILNDFITNQLLPSDLLGSLVNGIQPDAQAPQILRDFLAQIANIITPGSTTPQNPIADLLTMGYNAFLSMFGLATQAQAQISGIASQLAASTTGTSLMVIPMSLNPFSVSFGGPPGANGYMSLLDGIASWTPIGGVDRIQEFRNTTALNTDYGAVRATLPNPVQQALDGSQSYTYLRGRIDLGDTCDVHCRIGFDSVAVGFKTFGSRQLLGTPVSITTRPNDEWLFQFGTAASKYEYSVWQNGVPVIPSITEAFPNSHDSSNGAIYPGWAAWAGDRAFHTTQTLPASLSGITAYDVDI